MERSRLFGRGQGLFDFEELDRQDRERRRAEAERLFGSRRDRVLPPEHRIRKKDLPETSRNIRIPGWRKQYTWPDSGTSDVLRPASHSGLPEATPRYTDNSPEFVRRKESEME